MLKYQLHLSFHPTLALRQPRLRDEVVVPPQISRCCPEVLVCSRESRRHVRDYFFSLLRVIGSGRIFVVRRGVRISVGGQVSCHENLVVVATVVLQRLLFDSILHEAQTLI